MSRGRAAPGHTGATSLGTRSARRAAAPPPSAFLPKQTPPAQPRRPRPPRPAAPQVHDEAFLPELISREAVWQGENHARSDWAKLPDHRVTLRPRLTLQADPSSLGAAAPVAGLA